MRILIVAESFLPRVNGVSNSVQKVCEYLKARGHEVVVIAPDSKLTTGSTHQTDQTSVQRVRCFNFSQVPGVDIGIISVFKMQKFISDFKPDVVHLASPFLLGHQGCMAARNLGIPVVSIYQTDVAGFTHFYGFPKASKIAIKLTRRIHNSSTLNLVPSSWTLSEFRSLGIPNTRIWGRGVNVELFDPGKRSQKLREQWCADQKTIVGYLGRLAPEKQIEKLSALDTQRYQVVIIGDGPSASELKLTLPQAIFTGQLSGESLATALASIDILVSTGENETFCQVIQEAMASGIPVVAPRSGGPIDLINEGQTGFLYQPGNTKSMLQHVATLAENPKLRAQFGYSARSQVLSNTWDAVCDRLFSFYHEAIDANRQKVA
jgi:phosphatidylinositol alpha 1,6-mannosyltransferase